MSNYFTKFWIVGIAVLLICLISGGVVLAIKLSSQRPTEISLLPTNPPDYAREIYIDGAVANPGIYPLKDDDTIGALLQAAGTNSGANQSLLKLYIPLSNESSLQPRGQKISLNCAEVWLLKALPGIGDVKAQAIVEYRSKHGAFSRIEDLLKVSGISEATLNNIKNFITVEY